ncbi:pyridoxamine 5'-phosphate oxidase family protein [Streptomyces cinereoruber]|uniref:pyridoxamine 5'-phosphate oxidase family protein n=1 Tax=Streptomyces cinereoruber TaxID=67260 RepID=UPI0036271976
MATEIAEQDAQYLEFWQERHLCTLTTLRRDGRPHMVPVGVTLDAERGIARVITRKSSQKVRNILAATPGQAHAAISQFDGGRWATLEGFAEVRTDPDVVREAVERYADRYGRTPAPDPERVVIEITIDRTMGQATLTTPPATIRSAA